METEEGKKVGFDERLKKVEETLEYIISTLEKIVEKKKAEGEVI